MTQTTVENTQYNREALRRQGMSVLTSTGPALASAPLGAVIQHDMPQAGGVSFVVPVNRNQFPGQAFPTTSFRFATDEEMRNQ